MGVASSYIIVFNVLYMFPYTYPVTDPQYMNWSSVIFTGITVLLGLGYLWKRTRGYEGPQVNMNARDDILRGVIGLEEEMRKARRA